MSKHSNINDREEKRLIRTALIFNRNIPINYGNEPKIYGIRSKKREKAQKNVETDQ